MNTLQNKVVLITGASSGIGEALAHAFAQQGATVVLAARRIERLQQMATEIKQAGGKALAVACDVTNENDLPAAVTQIHQTFGSIDIVVANAGFGVVGKFEKLHLEDYQRQFNTNVFGVLRTIYATLDDLKKTQGQLVLIGSVASYISGTKSSPYAMSKYAIRSLAESLYAELAPQGIAITLITPGFIDTEIRHVNNQGEYQLEIKKPAYQKIRMPAKQAAQIMLKAIQRKKREKVITFHGKAALFINFLFPGLMPHFFRWYTLRKFKKSNFQNMTK